MLQLLLGASHDYKVLSKSQPPIKSNRKQTDTETDRHIIDGQTFITSAILR